MNKFTRLSTQTMDEAASKKLPAIMNKAKLGLENHINNIQLKILDKESVLESLDLQFAKGDTSLISQILEERDNLAILKSDLKAAQAYADEMFKEEKK